MQCFRGGAGFDWCLSISSTVLYVLAQCWNSLLNHLLHVRRAPGRWWLPHCSKESRLNLRSQGNPSWHETNESGCEWRRPSPCLATDVLTRSWALGGSEVNAVEQPRQPWVSSLVKLSINRLLAVQAETWHKLTWTVRSLPLPFRGCNEK